MIAALGNFIGAHFGAKVAKTVGDGLVTLPTGIASLGVVFAGVLGAISWNLLTWYFGLPSSSSHALFGGLVGATLFAAGATVQWANIAQKVLLPMVVSPMVGFLLGAIVMFLLLWSIKGLTVLARRLDEPPASPTSVDMPEKVVVGAGVGAGSADPATPASIGAPVSPAPSGSAVGAPGRSAGRRDA